VRLGDLLLERLVIIGSDFFEGVNGEKVLKWRVVTSQMSFRWEILRERRVRREGRESVEILAEGIHLRRFENIVVISWMICFEYCLFGFVVVRCMTGEMVLIGGLLLIFLLVRR